MLLLKKEEQVYSSHFRWSVKHREAKLMNSLSTLEVNILQKQKKKTAKKKKLRNELSFWYQNKIKLSLIDRG